MIGGILLAAGLSQRYGKEKLLEKIGEAYVFEYALAQCHLGSLSPCIVVCRHPQIAQKARDYGMICIQNDQPHLGQSHSIALGLGALPPGVEAVVFFAADQPLVSREVLRDLIAKYRETGDIVVSVYAGERGAPVLFPRRFFQELKALPGDQGGRVLIQKYQDTHLSFVHFSSEEMHWDVDTPEDLEKIRRYLETREALSKGQSQG